MSSRFFAVAVVALLAALNACAASSDERELVLEVLRGHLLSANGEYGEAAEVLGQIGVAQKNPDIMQGAIRAAIHGEQLEMAQQLADAWAAQDDSALARQWQAELMIARGQGAAAEPLLARLMENGEQPLEHLRRQLLQMRDGQTALAMGWRLFPPSGEGRYFLAQVALAYADEGAAREAVRQGRAAAPDNMELLFLDGRLALARQEEGAALALLRDFAQRECEGAVRHCSLDGLLWAFEQYISGEEWREALDAEEGDAEQWAVAAGQWHERWGNAAAARSAYARGGEAFAARAGLARLAEEEGDVDGALEILLASDVQNSEEFSSRERTIAHLYSESGRLQEAVARMADALKTLPDNFSLLYYYSLLLEMNDELDGALAALRRITFLFPDNPEGWNALGYVLADNNQSLDEALDYIGRALQAKPNDPHIIDSLGWVYYRLGNLSAARVQLQKASELSDSAEIYAHYGEVLWEMGDYGEARRIWQEARARDPDNTVLNETIERYRPF